MPADRAVTGRPAGRLNQEELTLDKQETETTAEPAADATDRVEPVPHLAPPLMSFSEALLRLKNGFRMQRVGWNGRGMFVFAVAGSIHGTLVEASEFYDLPAGATLMSQPYLAMRTADGSTVPWLASQADLLTDDWRVFEGQARPVAPLPTTLH